MHTANLKSPNQWDVFQEAKDAGDMDVMVGMELRIP